MNEQNYANHARFVKGFHFLLGTVLIIGTIISIVNIWLQWSAGNGVMNPVLITLLFICNLMIGWYARVFPLKAQDRGIRAEESLRYFVLTRKPLDSKLSMGQIIALRFAADDEFVQLADRAVNENLSPDDIKKAVKLWRADHHRV
jgi:uncharacterized protein DUF6526